MRKHYCRYAIEALLIVMRGLFIELDPLTAARMLTEWDWIVPDSMSPLWLNSFGDWAFTSPDGRVFFLDLLEGTFHPIASSRVKLESFLAQEENRNKWLMDDWFHICNERGLYLAKGQCYGWKVAPIIGGKCEFANIQIFDVVVYESIMGQIHRQVQKLPPGATISNIKVG